MSLRGWVIKGNVAVLASAALLFASAPAVLADSGSLTVSDAGHGSMSVKAEATRSGCGEGLCAWYAGIVERHSTLPCANDFVFRVGVVGFSTDAGTVRQELTFRPFFPRSAKLCLYVQPVIGKTELVAETTYKVPAGYGKPSSSQFNCGSFELQAAAQYYLYMYPQDPSALDSDRNGTVCEETPCPCSAEPIPAEPVLKVNPAVCKKARAHRRQAQAALRSTRRHLRQASGPQAKQRWSRQLKQRQAALRKAKDRQRKACSVPRA